jgi:hypothetical protein
LAGGSQASAGGAVESDVTLKFNHLEFEFRGKVTSERAKCRKNREVRIFRKEDGADQLLGVKKTDSAGKYTLGGFGSVEGSTPHYTIASKKVTDAFTCVETKSKNVKPDDFKN